MNTEQKINPPAGQTIDAFARGALPACHAPFQALPWEGWPIVDQSPALHTALHAAAKAGELLFHAFFQNFERHLKADRSDYTKFDAEAERLAAQIIRAAEPHTPIMGEEIAGGEGGWYIDGIDGTTNFSHGIPVCNFTLARTAPDSDGNLAIDVGVVYDFLHGELFYAKAGQGAFLNGIKLTVANRLFSEAVISFAPLLPHPAPEGTRAIDRERAVNAVWRGMHEVTRVTGRFHREFQSGGLELAWLAAGRLDGYAGSWTSPWDLSAGVLLIKEAGGIATNILGEDWRPSYNGVIAGSPLVHPPLLEIITAQFNKM